MANPPNLSRLEFSRLSCAVDTTIRNDVPDVKVSVIDGMPRVNEAGVMVFQVFTEKPGFARFEGNKPRADIGGIVHFWSLSYLFPA
jgi:hypothetical protein